MRTSSPSDAPGSGRCSDPSCPALLRHHLGPLTPALEVAAQAARGRSLAAGQVLLAPGQRWSALWVVAGGALRLHHVDRRGREATKNFFLPGALLWPITDSLCRQPVAFCIEALGPTQVWQLDWPTWSAQARDDPAWQALVQRTLVALLEDKMERERQFLHCSAAERYQLLIERHPDWLAALPLRHLASWLGITDVALSRIRRRLNPG